MVSPDYVPCLGDFGICDKRLEWGLGCMVGLGCREATGEAELIKPFDIV